LTEKREPFPENLAITDQTKKIISQFVKPQWILTQFAVLSVELCLVIRIQNSERYDIRQKYENFFSGNFGITYYFVLKNQQSESPKHCSERHFYHLSTTSPEWSSESVKRAFRWAKTISSLLVYIAAGYQSKSSSLRCPGQSQSKWSSSSITLSRRKTSIFSAEGPCEGPIVDGVHV